MVVISRVNILNDYILLAARYYPQDRKEMLQEVGRTAEIIKSCGIVILVIIGLIGIAAIFYIFFGVRTQAIFGYSAPIETIRGNRYRDIELELQIEDIVNRCQDNEEIYQRLRNELTSVYGSDFRNMFDLPTQRNNWTGMLASTPYWAKHLLLAQCGIVADEAWLKGYYLGDVDNYKDNINLCKQIESDLNAAGADVILILRYDSESYKTGNAPIGEYLIAKHRPPKLGKTIMKKRLW